MTVFAEFVGGPLDGQVREMSDARDRWYVPDVRPVESLVLRDPSEPPPLVDPLIYEKVGRRIVDTPTGEPVFRFKLLGLKAMSACPLCGDEAWICEQHPDRGWPHDDCAGPGMPCPDCNTDDPPRFGPGVLAVEYLTHEPQWN